MRTNIIMSTDWQRFLDNLGDRYTIKQRGEVEIYRTERGPESQDSATLLRDGVPVAAMMYQGEPDPRPVVLMTNDEELIRVIDALQPETYAHNISREETIELTPAQYERLRSTLPDHSFPALDAQTREGNVTTREEGIECGSVRGRYNRFTDQLQTVVLQSDDLRVHTMVMHVTGITLDSYSSLPPGARQQR